MKNNYFADWELRIDKIDNEDIKRNMIYLRDTILNPLRKMIGIIDVTSGYRDEDYNKKIGGAINSHHLCKGGFAATDIIPRHTGILATFDIIKKNFDYAELLLEMDQGCVHVSTNIDPKKNVKKTKFRDYFNGKTKWVNI